VGGGVTGERVSYSVACRAMRQSLSRAVSAELPPACWKALAVVWWYTTSYSKLSDAVALPELAGKGGLSKDGMGRALGQLAEAGVIAHRPGRHRGDLTCIGVPPEGVKVDAWRSPFDEPAKDDAQGSPFYGANGRPSLAERPTERTPKGRPGVIHARTRAESREEQEQRLSVKEPLVSEPSRSALDHVEGETTTAAETDPAITDRLIAALAKREPPVRVEQADDGSLVWSGEQQDGEQGLFDDFQALVDAGLGEWRQNDAEGER
jgi:hypothetical protein